MRLYSFFLTAHWFGAMCAGPVSCYTQITYNGCKRGKGERRKKERNSFHSLRPCWCPPQTLDLDSPFWGWSFYLDSLWFPPLQRPVLSVLYIPPYIHRHRSMVTPSSQSLHCLPQNCSVYRELLNCSWAAPGAVPGKNPEITSRCAFPPSLFYIFLRLGHSRLLYRLEWLWK
jgi:hypothetical protein